MLGKNKPVLSDRVRGMLVLGSMIFFLLSITLAVDISRADEVSVIRNIQEWQHPVKSILDKNKVIIYKVELHNKTYPIFYVNFPYDPRLAHNDNYFKPLYYDTLKANGFWNYAFIDRSFHCRISISWDKKSRTLDESLEDIN